MLSRLTNGSSKGGEMARYSLYVKLALIVLVLGAMAVAFGGAPWGPD
jgi:hypothetical protein